MDTGTLSFFANILIAIFSITANIYIKHKNSGKNTVIYAMEEMSIDASRQNPLDELNVKLNSGQYTVMNIIQDVGNYTKRIYTLGKTK